jgi:hypothetical protein
MLSPEKRDETFVTIELPFELLNDLRRCQKANERLQSFGLDHLVTTALVKYLQENKSDETSRTIPDGEAAGSE